MVTNDEYETRKAVWSSATQFVEPLVEKHELKEYRVSSAVFTGTSVTAVEQHISAIITVADWLIGRD